MIDLRQTPIFETWLGDLRDRRAAKIIAKRMLRVQAGLFGDASPVGEGVSELRIDYGPGYRVYFVQRGRTVVILLCGGDKGSQPRDIAKALAMAKEV